MVLPLLEFLKERVENGTLSYPMHDLDQARLDLVRPTHMVDYAEDLYKSLHGHSTTPDAIPAQQLEAQKKDVYTQLEALKQQCEKLDKFPEEEKVCREDLHSVNPRGRTPMRVVVVVVVVVV